MTPAQIDAFTTWMRDVQKYRDATIRDTLRDLSSATRQWQAGTKFHPRLRHALMRMQDYLRAGGELELPPAFVSAAVTYCTQLAQAREAKGNRGGRAPQRRKHDAISCSDEEWQALAQVIGKDTKPAGRVLWAMMASGLRVGDVLRVQTAKLTQALRSGLLPVERKGGEVKLIPIRSRMEDVWRPLHEALVAANAPSVAAYVSPSNPSTLPGDPAYGKIDYRLKRHARDLGLEGRFNLHRLRRTVAVQLLEESQGDMHMTSQALGHASQRTTAIYVDEVNARKVDAALGSIARRMLAPAPAPPTAALEVRSRRASGSS